MAVRILEGDALTQLATLPAESVHCVVTSPPYWGLRSYGGDAGMIGLEPTLDEHIANLVAVFREVWRVLRKDGTVWLNYGDAYCSVGHKKSNSGYGSTGLAGGKAQEHSPLRRENDASDIGLKHKDLMMLPARVALALQAAGWWLRSEIIWAKPNPMPESVTDRPTSAHEKIFLLSKASRYFYDAEAVREAAEYGRREQSAPLVSGNGGSQHRSGGGSVTGADPLAGRNLRNVWTIATHSFSDAHFATFPPKLVEPCIKAGTSEKGCCVACGSPWRRVVTRETQQPENISPKLSSHHNRNDGERLYRVGETKATTTGWQPTCECNAETQPCQVLDPFGGAGTVGLVADRLGRNATLIEINAEYAEMARARITQDAPLFTEVA